MKNLSHWPIISMRSLKVSAQTINPSIKRIHEILFEILAKFTGPRNIDVKLLEI